MPRLLLTQAGHHARQTEFKPATTSTMSLRSKRAFSTSSKICETGRKRQLGRGGRIQKCTHVAADPGQSSKPPTLLQPMQSLMGSTVENVGWFWRTPARPLLATSRLPAPPTWSFLADWRYRRPRPRCQPPPKRAPHRRPSRPVHTEIR